MIKDWNLSFLPNTSSSSSSSSLSHKTPLLFPSSSHETIHNNKNKNNNNNNTTIIGLCTPPGMCNLGATCYLNIQFQYLASNPVFFKGAFSWTTTTTSTSTSRPIKISEDHGMNLCIMQKSKEEVKNSFITIIYPTFAMIVEYHRYLSSTVESG